MSTKLHEGVTEDRRPGRDAAISGLCSVLDPDRQHATLKRASRPTAFGTSHGCTDTVQHYSQDELVSELEIQKQYIISYYAYVSHAHFKEAGDAGAQWPAMYDHGLFCRCPERAGKQRYRASLGT